MEQKGTPKAYSWSFFHISSLYYGNFINHEFYEFYLVVIKSCTNILLKHVTGKNRLKKIIYVQKKQILRYQKRFFINLIL